MTRGAYPPLQSPADHYAEAERLLRLADSEPSLNWAVTCGETKADVLAAAQVHATLALASWGNYQQAQAMQKAARPDSEASS
jgi:hypothetical protein